MLVGAPINLYVYLNGRFTPKILPYKTKIQYSLVEEVQDHKDLKHNGARGTLDFLNVTDGVEIIHTCDLPSRTGLGSSSAFIVGLLKILHELYGTGNISPKNLAKQAIKIEREILAEPGGIQDACWAATDTGLSTLTIEKSGDFTIKPISISRDFAEYFTSCLTLVYIGAGRDAFEISKSLDVPEADIIKHRFKDLSYLAINAFEDENIFESQGIAELLEETWELKKAISPKVSNDKIDLMYEQVKNLGAKAFKLLGTGGNGMGVVLLRPEERGDFIEKMRNLGHECINFQIDYSGSTIVYRGLECKSQTYLNCPNDK